MNQSMGDGGFMSPTIEAHPARQYTVGEEIANSVAHGVGAALSVAGLVLLIIFANRGGGGLKLISAIAFGTSLILEYLASTLYHAIPAPRAKATLRIFDHAAIYLLIAGTYTPFLLVVLANYGGLTMCIVLWAIACAGILLEVVLRERQPKWVSAVIYLALGWFIVFKLPVLISVIDPRAFWLLVAGGLSYTVGTLFYIPKNKRYTHFVWHLFVLGGSICHFFAVLLFIF
jgi:hemolysin III